MKRTRRLAVRGLAIVVALVLWEILGLMMGDKLFAAPSIVIPEYLRLLQDGTMLGELAGSLRHMLFGYALACCVGMPLGIAMGRVRACDAIFHPWVSLFVVTSVASLVPLFIVMLGTGFWFRVWIVFIAAVWYITLAAYHGARGVESRWVDVGRAFAAGRLQLFWKVIVPALYPYLITGARLGLIHAVRAMVVAEMFVIVGYGGLIYNAGLEVSTAPLLGLLVTLMLLGIALNSILRLAGRFLAPWHEERIVAP